MLPGRKYNTPEAVLALIRRRFWFVLVPAAVCAAVAVAWAARLPDIYQSETTILIVPQRISEDIVRSPVSAITQERLGTLSQAITSRRNLEELIQQVDLYPNERRSMVMEDVIGLMRAAVVTRIVQNDAFQVSYEGDDPAKVMQVTQRLGRLFIDQSLSYRHNLVEDTSEFLESQLAERRRQLEEQERRVAEYQRAHAGQLPSQVNSNLQQVTTASVQMQAAQETVNRAMERRLVIEGRIAALENNQTPVPVLPPDDRTPAVVGDTMQQLTAAREAVARFEARGLQPGHPDLDRAQRQLVEIERKWTEEVRARGASGEPVASLSPAEATRLARLQEARAELLEIERQIARARDDEQRARAASEEAQRRLDALPNREAELVALTRDYDIIEGSYRSLLEKREQARISASLERRQVGEQFSVLEPARLPERPIRPNRGQIYFIGVVLGMVVGVLAVAYFEVRDKAFRTEEELISVVGLPVLAVISSMQSEAERRRTMWKAIAVNGGCAVVVLVSAATIGYVLFG